MKCELSFHLTYGLKHIERQSGDAKPVSDKDLSRLVQSTPFRPPATRDDSEASPDTIEG
jgi:hypothetical protein